MIISFKKFRINLCENVLIMVVLIRPLVSTRFEYRLPVPVVAISKVPITSTSTGLSKYRLSVPVVTEFSVSLSVPVSVLPILPTKPYILGQINDVFIVLSISHFFS